eukprot:403359204
MGTDYDPPTRTQGVDEYQMSDATLRLLERELGQTNSLRQQNAQQSQMLNSFQAQTEDSKVQPEELKQSEIKQTYQQKNGRTRAFHTNNKNENHESEKKEKEPISKTKEKRHKWHEAKKEKKEQREDDWANGTHKKKTDYELLEMKNNEDFKQYYKNLRILPEEEFETFYKTLQEPLDICFRVNSVDKHFAKTQQEINDLILKIKQIEDIKDKVPKRLEWYPNDLAYTFNECSRAEMRANPLLKNFHQFLILETEMGRIFRQEAVSMIPVTLLKIEPHHSVIDMCAAPGSKTIQILEYLHQGMNKVPNGFVIANDTDQKRAYLLTHQARRLNSSALLITNNDARFMPNMRFEDAQKHHHNLKYDRILCDVPCSGDGTLRKNLALWRNFNSHLGHACHPLQLDILERAFKMLKKGGRLVYSTCSFNPIENEAVVAAALSRHIKQMELVDVSSEVSPHLKYRPGLVNWRVYHRAKGKRIPEAWYESYDKVQNIQRKIVKETMFTDTYTMFNNEPDRTDDMKNDPLNLRRCMRFFPHDDNQGGFFVAVFTKIHDQEEGIVYDDMYSMNAWSDPKVKQKPILEDLRDFAEDYEKELKAYEEKHNVPADQSQQNQILQMVKEAQAQQKQQLKESGVQLGKMSQQVDEEKEHLFPFEKLIDNKQELWMNLQMFYGISSEFPSENLYFQKDTTNFIVFGSNGINTLMRCQRKYKFKVVNMGVKLFCKNRDNKSPAQVSLIKSYQPQQNLNNLFFSYQPSPLIYFLQYRLLQEGLEILMPYMSDDRKIPVSKLLFAQFLDKFNFTQDELAKMGHAEQFAGRDQGSAVMVCGGDLYVTIWIGVNNVSLMIGKEEIKSFKFLLINQLE